MTLITAVTLEKVDLPHNDKFYRVFYGPSGAAFGQWGSQRNGRTGGQCRLFTSPQEAIEILGKKRSDGYIEVEVKEFDLQEAAWRNLQQVSPSNKDAVKDSVNVLETAYVARGSGSLTPARRVPIVEPIDGPTTPQVAADRIAELSNKYLEAIGRASEDPIEGHRVRAVLEAELEPLHAEFRKLTSYKETLEIVLGVQQ